MRRSAQTVEVHIVPSRQLLLTGVGIGFALRKFLRASVQSLDVLGLLFTEPVFRGKPSNEDEELIRIEGDSLIIMEDVS